MYEKKLEKCLDNLTKKLKTIRTGRPTPDILDGIRATYYNVPTPINQLGSISVVESSRLVINVFDTSAVQAVETAIAQSDLNANPQVDGTTVSITMPALTDDRRKALIKQVATYAEETRVAMRNVRRATLDQIKRDEDLSLEQRSGRDASLQKILVTYTKQLDAIIAKKTDALSAI